MLTIRQIDKLFSQAEYPRLARELLSGRVELSARTLLDCGKKVPCAALALIRLDEFAQTHHPLARQLVAVLLGSQDADGGWTDVATTALVLRALSTANGHGQAINCGLQYLQTMQKESGLWPQIPIRRAEADEMTSALVVHHLSHVPSAGAVIDLQRVAGALSTYRHPAMPSLRRPNAHHTAPPESPLFNKPRFALAS